MNVFENARVTFSVPKVTQLSRLEAHLNMPTVSASFPSSSLNVHSISPKDANFILDVGSRKPSLNRKERLAF